MLAEVLQFIQDRKSLLEEELEYDRDSLSQAEQDLLMAQISLLEEIWREIKSWS